MPARTFLIAVSCLCVAAQAYGQAPDGPAPIGTMQPQMGGGYLDGPPAPGNGDGLLPLPQSWIRQAFEPQPCIDARIDAIFLQANFSKSVPVASEWHIVNNQPVLTPLPIDHRDEYIAAPRGTLEWHWNEHGSLQVTGFTLDGPDDVRGVGQNDPTKYMVTANGGFLTNVPAGFPTYADALNVQWKLETDNIDFTLLHHFICAKGPISDLAVGVGARYFRVAERVAVQAIDEVNGMTGSFGAETENTMGGVQFTGRMRVITPLPRLRFWSEGKIGLMANSFDQQQAVYVNGAVTSGGRQSNTVFAPIFEGNFMLEYLVYKNFTIYGGYQILFVDRINRASGQIRTDLSTYNAQTKSLGSLLYTGPHVGIAFYY